MAREEAEQAAAERFRRTDDDARRLSAGFEAEWGREMGANVIDDGAVGSNAADVVDTFLSLLGRSNRVIARAAIQEIWRLCGLQE